MTELEKTLLESLTRLERAALPSSSPDRKTELISAITEVDRLTVQMPKTTDPTLLHYLYKKSYEKALLFLKGRDQENQLGNCRHTDL